MNHWAVQAACRDEDPGMFAASARGRAAIEGFRMCRTCSVRTECLDAALATAPDRDALVWGGTTERHRRDIRHGRLTKASAMRLGDAIAKRLTQAEIEVRDGLEPDGETMDDWLERAVPTGLRAAS